MATYQRSLTEIDAKDMDNMQRIEKKTSGSFHENNFHVFVLCCFNHDLLMFRSGMPDF